MSYKQIQASEISNYVYCRRAWWLDRTSGHQGENIPGLAAGLRYHEQHGRTVQRSYWARRLAYVLVYLIVAFVTFQILMGL